MSKAKILIPVLMLGLFTVSTIQAQEKNATVSKVEVMKEAAYTCSMHPEVKSDSQGECPKCGMKLEKMEMKQDKMDKTYSCTMHPEVKKDKSGECPKCGMKLEKMEIKKDSLKMAHGKMDMKHDKMAKTYTCTMHPEVKSNKSGECPKCGMKLEKMDMKKDKDHKH